MENKTISEEQIEKSLSDIPVFEKIPIKGEKTAEMERARKYINANYRILYYWNFTGNVVIVFLKQLVRKTVKCILSPIVEKQNELNANFVRCTNGLNRLETESSKRLAQLEIQVFQLAQRNEDLEKKLQSVIEENGRICRTAECFQNDQKKTE